MSRKKAAHEATKLFVLDTNILMHDPTCIFRFKEHDVFIPTMVLEELDDHKKGTTELARNVRQAMRLMTELFESIGTESVTSGISLSSTGSYGATGRLYFQDDAQTAKIERRVLRQKADNQILAIASILRAERTDRRVILVSKDLNIRLGASSKGIPSEDYSSDNVLEDSDIIFSGYKEISYREYERLMKAAQVSRRDHRPFYTLRRASSKLARSLVVNETIIHPDHAGKPQALIVDSVTKTSVTVRQLENYAGEKRDVMGVTAKNTQQNIALNLLMDKEIDFVTLLGRAGSGKTLLTIASGLEQIFGTGLYQQIIMTRATVPIGEDIGYLPGTEEEKMGPWMGALNDNLDFLLSGSKSREGRAKFGMDDIMDKVKIKSLSFMRGRTFANKYVIIDEAQNLTAKQMKALVTRAGNGTKVVCLGNIAQIDTPYLTEGNSGITYAIERFKGWNHYGHVTLPWVVRSRLAEHASEVMQG